MKKMNVTKKISMVAVATGMLLTGITNAQTWLTSGNASVKTDTLGTKTNQSVNFITNNASRMFISKTGQVGIGTTTPAFLFDVQGPGNASMSFKSTTGTANVILDRFNSGSTAGVNYRTNGVPYWQTGTINNDNFVIRNLNLGAPAFAILYSNSNIGVGTNTPADKFTVAGGTTAADTVAVISAKVNYVGNFDVAAITAESAPAGGYGLGVDAYGDFIGVAASSSFIGAYGYSQGFDTTVANTGTVYGLYGQAALGASGIGVYGTSGYGNFQYGVYGTTLNGNADTAGVKKWAGYFIGDIAATRYFNFSDGRLKTNVQPINNAVESLKKIKTGSYDFKRAEYPDLDLPAGKQLGFFAENVETVFPELVKDATSAKITDKKRNVVANSVSFKAVNYTGLLPVVVEAIKEQQLQLDAKDKQIAEQQAKLNDLQNQINTIKEILEKSNANRTAVSLQNNSELSQNIPNPVNGTSEIKYLISENKTGSIAISDAKGNAVKTINGLTGSGIVTIDTAKLAAGNYSYSLIVNGEVIASKTMVVVK